MKRLIVILAMLLGSFANAQDFDFDCGFVTSDPFYGFSETAYNAPVSEAHKLEFLESLADENNTFTIDLNNQYNEFWIYLNGNTFSYYAIKRNGGYNHWKEKIEIFKYALGYPHVNAPTEEEAAADVIEKAAKAIGRAYPLVNPFPTTTYTPPGGVGSVSVSAQITQILMNDLQSLLNDQSNSVILEYKYRPIWAYTMTVKEGNDVIYEWVHPGGENVGFNPWEISNEVLI